MTILLKFDQPSHDKIANCFLVKGQIYYDGPYDKVIRDFPEVFTETYEEALVIVQAQNPGIDLAVRPTKEQTQKWKCQKVNRKWSSFWECGKLLFGK